MNCQDVQLNISLGITGTLEVGSAELSQHIAECGECAVRVERTRRTAASLRALRRPEMPAGLLALLRTNIAEMAEPARTERMFAYETTPFSIRTWLFPSVVGSLATVMIVFGLLSATLSEAKYDTSNEIAANRTRPSTVLLTDPNLDPSFGEFKISSSDYARLRMSVAGESPSINPQGALVALTRSLVRGEMKDDELTVVADVFGNGLARIAEVVEPSDNSRAIEQLDKALRSDPDFAPFVPAKMDHREDTMRVVLKIQSVNVEIGN